MRANTTWGQLIELRYGKAMVGPKSDSGPTQVFGTNGPIGFADQPPIYNSPSVVIGRKGAYRGVHQTKGPFHVIDTAFYVVPRKKIDIRWCYYALKCVDINSLGSGSAIPSTRREDVYELDVYAPTLSNQQAIAEFLGALDAKISANDDIVSISMRMSHLLVASLRWRTRRTSISDIASMLTRGMSPKYTEHGTQVINQKCVRNGLVDRSIARQTAKLDSTNMKLLQKNDVLVNSTGQGTLGRIARWTQDDADATTDSHISIVRFNPTAVNPAFAGTVLAGMQRQIEDLAEGSTGQTELRRDLLGSLELELPERGIQDRVGLELTALAESIDARQNENQILAQTRDELLPLLMDGRITVKHAEQAVEEVL